MKRKITCFIIIVLLGVNLTIAQKRKVDLNLVLPQSKYNDSLSLGSVDFSFASTGLKLNGNSLFFRADYSFKRDSSDLFKNGSWEINTELEDLHDIAFKTQKYFALPPGKYSFDLHAVNQNDTSQKIASSFNYWVDDFSKRFVSDLIHIDRFGERDKSGQFVRYGYKFETKICLSTCLYESMDSVVRLYFELYNKDSILLVERYLINDELKNPVERYYKIDSLQKYRTKMPFTLVHMDMSDLPSGSYSYLVNIISSERKIVDHQRVSFSWINKRNLDAIKLKSAETPREVYADIILSEFELNNNHNMNKALGALAVIETSNANSIYSLIGQKNLFNKQNYFLSFWEDNYPQRPQDAIRKYMKRTQEIERLYARGKAFGYKTPRGRIRLQHGDPFEVEIFDLEAGVNTPFEIWLYTTTNVYKRQAVCVFQMIDNEYRLIHSTIPGEVNNPNWKSQTNFQGNSNIIP